MTLLLLVLLLVVLGVLAYQRALLWTFALTFAVFGLFGALALNPAWLVILAIGAVLGLLCIEQVRMAVITGPAYSMVRRILPRVSRTEQEALDAGTVGWDAELFSGRPRWEKLLDIGKPVLNREEQAFMDGPAEELCAMLDDWQVRHELNDMPEDVWQFIKDEKFLGMLISKEHGGLGFSAQAQSQIISKIASRSVAAGISIMVPNSLGPGELLEKYGTDAQKAQYLERLAKGQEIPCFALTGSHAGSDAAGMRDVGIVTYGTYKGKKVLGVKLSWDKRYITLAPVATLLGLAFNLYDPENHLGKGENIGITLALVPSDYPGVEIGKRHFPARAAFMNGPTRGTEVFVPMEFLIGGPDYAGQGWRMLMECLSTGRAISLPAIGTISIKQSLRVTSAYARIRRQFGIPVGVMEGVAGPIGRMVKASYMYEAGRAVTATMVDESQKPAVISALLKYRTTAAMRDCINDAMDVHGGRAVQDGPSNYLFSGYMTTPVAITVEGANILTRSLITFAQGVLRAHPYLYKEIEAVQNPDRKAGLKAFDKAFRGHVGFMGANKTGSLFHGLTSGAFAPAPANVAPGMKHWYKKLHRYSQSFALVADWTVAFLGGQLKARQELSGRMADILSDLYYLSATLKRFEDDGRIAEDAPVVDAIARDLIFDIEQGFKAVFDNFPNAFLAGAMRFLVLPLGAHATPASDRTNFKLAGDVLKPGAWRDRLTRGVYVSFDPEDRTGVLEDALVKVTDAEEIEQKFFRAIKKGQVQRRLDRDAIDDAVEAGILNGNEAGILRAADEATDQAIKVDEFEPQALTGQPSDGSPRAATTAAPKRAASRSATTTKAAKPKTATRRKPAAKSGGSKPQKSTPTSAE